MAKAVEGNTVRVHYTGTLQDGTVFDTSRKREPIEFTLGGGQVIPGFDEAVSGMTVGEKETATIPADQAYGPRQDELVLTVPRSNLPDGLSPEPGDQLQMTTQDGQAVPVKVAEVQDDAVILDANHPLAGEDLTFELELVEIA
ncbi:MAG: peptidylprolyl isomerase [Gemmatimonadota bacterium]